MAEGNGEIIEEMATTNKTDGGGEPERTADYPKLVEYGLDKRVSFCVIFFCLSSFLFHFIRTHKYTDAHEHQYRNEQQFSYSPCGTRFFCNFEY